MIVSKTSWRYRLYAWTKRRWDFDRRGINESPSKLNFYSTILLQFPATGLLWLAIGLIMLVVMLSDGYDLVKRLAFGTRTRSVISCFVLFFALNIGLVYLGSTMSVPAKAMAYFLAVGWGFILALIVVFCAIAFTAMVGIPWLFKRAKGAWPSKTHDLVTFVD